MPCLAYAVDTWVGEPHAGFYDERVYEEVQAYNQANYSSFSYLLRKLFDEALEQFDESSIDLLHIDGMHTLEAVSHDFYSWLPKVKPGGIVLLHDICVRDRDFGVWKLWRDLKSQGRTFEFHHSWGLGVFEKPGAGARNSGLLEALFDGPSSVQDQVRRYYVLAANELDLKYRRSSASDKSLAVQIYPSSPAGYQESHCTTVDIEAGQWQHVVVDIEGTVGNPLRIDPGNAPAVVEVRGMSLISPVDQSTVWSCSGPELSKLSVGGTLTPLGLEEATDVFRYFSYGQDPQLYLPSLSASQFDQPLTLHLWLRSFPELHSLLPIIQGTSQQATTIPLRSEPGVPEASEGSSPKMAETQQGRPPAYAVQIFSPSREGYEESRSTAVSIEAGQWQHVVVEITEGTAGCPLRIDPASAPAIVEVRGISLTSPVDRHTVWSCSGSQLSGLEVGGTLKPLGLDAENEAFRFFSYGQDPQLYVPVLSASQFDQPLTLHLWLRLHVELESLLPLIEESLRRPDAIASDAEFTGTQERGEAISEEAGIQPDPLGSYPVARKALIDNLNRKQTNVYLLEDARKELREENTELHGKLASLEKFYSELQDAYSALEASYMELQASHQDLEQKHENVIQSRSWRLTAPLRGIAETIR